MLKNINDNKADKKRRSNELSDVSKQDKIDKFPRLSQGLFSKLILNFVCDVVLPFSTVKNSSFVKLMNRICPNQKVPDRRTISKSIIQEFSAMKQLLKAKFEDIDDIIKKKISA